MGQTRPDQQQQHRARRFPKAHHQRCPPSSSISTELSDDHSDCTKNRIHVVETETAAAESAGCHSLTTTRRCFPGERPGRLRRRARGSSARTATGTFGNRRCENVTLPSCLGLWLAKFKPVLNLHFWRAEIKPGLLQSCHERGAGRQRPARELFVTRGFSRRLSAYSRKL